MEGDSRLPTITFQRLLILLSSMVLVLSFRRMTPSYNMPMCFRWKASSNHVKVAQAGPLFLMSRNFNGSDACTNLHNLPHNKCKATSAICLHSRKTIHSTITIFSNVVVFNHFFFIFCSEQLFLYHYPKMTLFKISVFFNFGDSIRITAVRQLAPSVVKNVHSTITFFSCYCL